MDFETKHLLIVIVIVCGFWTLSVPSIKHFGEFTHSIELNSELGHQPTAIPLGGTDSWESVVRALNIALPMGVGALALLLIFYSNNPIGVLPLLLAGMLLGFGVNGLLKTKCELERGSGLCAADEVWWLSPEDKADSSVVPAAPAARSYKR